MHFRFCCRMEFLGLSGDLESMLISAEMASQAGIRSADMELCVSSVLCRNDVSAPGTASLPIGEEDGAA